jgi:hypothetical protein
MSAFTAGFFMTCTVCPVDVVRTRLMNQPPDSKLYSGSLDCIYQIVKEDGIQGLFKGFIPIWARFAPVTCIQLVAYEKLRVLFINDK